MPSSLSQDIEAIVGKYDVPWPEGSNGELHQEQMVSALTQLFNKRLSAELEAFLAGEVSLDEPRPLGEVIEDRIAQLKEAQQ